MGNRDAYNSATASCTLDIGADSVPHTLQTSISLDASLILRSFLHRKTDHIGNGNVSLRYAQLHHLLLDSREVCAILFVHLYVGRFGSSHVLQRIQLWAGCQL